MDMKSHRKSVEVQDMMDVFGTMKNANRFAIDIGGSLTRIAYYSSASNTQVFNEADKEHIKTSQSTDKDHQLDEDLQPAKLRCVKLETKYIENYLDSVQVNLVNTCGKISGQSIKATGNGVNKYLEILQQKLGLSVDKEDKMSCLTRGCSFLLKNISDETFVYQQHEKPEYKFQYNIPDIFPYLLVNIGYGVSIMKVVSENSYERIGGTAIGGGTYWGLGSLLTKAKGFDELMGLAEKGDHCNIDLLVRDLYEGDYKMLGLSGDLIASSFGKATNNLKKINSKAETPFSEADLARSLLFTISDNIGHVVSLYAMMHKLNKVYFCGYFVRNHLLNRHTISFSTNYWSSGQVQAHFLRHEDYMAVLGAFLKGAEEYDADKFTWLENYAGSSGFVSSHRQQTLSANCIDEFEIDHWKYTVTHCPLLQDPTDYSPDTVHVTQDPEDINSWLQLYKKTAENLIPRVTNSQPHSLTSQKRAQKFLDKFMFILNNLKHHHFAYGNLSVRYMEHAMEHCLRNLHFPDIYLGQKQVENEHAFGLFEKRLQYLDNLDWLSRQETLITSIIAGNMFDWGSNELVQLMENTDFGFEEACSKIQTRPWWVDCLDEWLDRMKGTPHKCAAIFVDNSGMDIILGIFPFVRELLQRGTKVILCANSVPALNDVTYPELLVLLKQAATVCQVIRKALNTGTLIAMETAQAGPFLDLSILNLDLTKAMASEEVDLLILEGMGRTLHTNLNVRFTCECLKLATLKTPWLAAKLGGKMFSVLCKYEHLNEEKTNKEK